MSLTNILIQNLTNLSTICYTLSAKNPTVLPALPFLDFNAVPSIQTSAAVKTLLITFVNFPLLLISFILLLYCLRHFIFAINRLFGTPQHFYAEIMEVNWPKVSILIPAHNEENVIGDLLEALLCLDYDKDLLQIIVINDRSTDKTATIVDDFAARHPIITHFKRQTGLPGKSAALSDATKMVTHPILLIFDADYIPGIFLIKQLVGPFFDPEVGLVMGRVIPSNSSKNLLTRLIDMERNGSYQVNQQARENLQLIPQYGGTAGGVRTQALLEVGSWNSQYLADDTEMTFRLVFNQWISVYQNKSECIELVPESWTSRNSQIKRWARGHNQVMRKYASHILFHRNINILQRIDGLFLLCIYLISPLLLTGWILFFISYLLNIVPGSSTLFGFLMIVSITSVGNATFFYEIAVALYLDNLRQVKGPRIRLLPLMFFSCFVSMFAISSSFISQLFSSKNRKQLVWNRTEHTTRSKN